MDVEHVCKNSRIIYNLSIFFKKNYTILQSILILNGDVLYLKGDFELFYVQTILQLIDMIPPEIEVACHNSSESSTISGPSDIMKEFVAKLTAKGIFAKEVPCSNIAYHSRYIAKAGKRYVFCFP